MRYSIYGKNIDVTDSLRSAITGKFSKLDKFFTEDTEVHITLRVQKGEQKVEAMIPMKGNILRAERASSDMYVSIEKVVDILERMIRKYKTKISRSGKGYGAFSESFMDEDVEIPESIIVSKSKRFAIKPMDVEEACVQMELIGHDFYVFRNAITYEVNVVYKRKDNTYGLIEPEF
ncbi:MAG: ribosome-associated translation inhibitor RaiA [Eubacteriales bacterium]|nr:ribosome-associated translation inhibitor RaiA [Eubacteriales bacterium]